MAVFNSSARSNVNICKYKVNEKFSSVGVHVQCIKCFNHKWNSAAIPTYEIYFIFTWKQKHGPGFGKNKSFI